MDTMSSVDNQTLLCREWELQICLKCWSEKALRSEGQATTYSQGNQIPKVGDSDAISKLWDQRRLFANDMRLTKDLAPGLTSKTLDSVFVPRTCSPSPQPGGGFPRRDGSPDGGAQGED